MAGPAGQPMVPIVAAEPVTRSDGPSVRRAHPSMPYAQHRDLRGPRAGTLITHNLILEIVVGAGWAEPVPNAHSGGSDIDIFGHLAPVARRLVRVVVVVASTAHPVSRPGVRRQPHVVAMRAPTVAAVVAAHHVGRGHAVRWVHALPVRAVAA
eukprot:scaffold44979_cov31-Tisochrysis_lutea.AAC.1